MTTHLLSHLFELLPVVLALIAAVRCGLAYKCAADRALRRVLGLAVICSVLLTVAQTSWWGSYILQGDLAGTEWANSVWTVFNSLVMAAFILLSRSVRRG